MRPRTGPAGANPFPLATPSRCGYGPRMSKAILVAGFGPGISNAVAERFGREGFRVAAIARHADRLATAVEALGRQRIEARAFPGDLGDPDRARELVARVRREYGPIDVLAWIAYSNAAGNLLEADVRQVRTTLEIATTSLLAAVREALPDLRERKGAVLVANGGFGLFDERVDALVVQTGGMGLAVANSAKHKLVGTLHHRLLPEGIHVGEVMVLNTVKGTAFDQGGATLEPSAVAEKFWEHYVQRAQTFVQIG